MPRARTSRGEMADPHGSLPAVGLRGLRSETEDLGPTAIRHLGSHYCSKEPAVNSNADELVVLDLLEGLRDEAGTPSNCFFSLPWLSQGFRPGGNPSFSRMTACLSFQDLREELPSTEDASGWHGRDGQRQIARSDKNKISSLGVGPGRAKGAWPGELWDGQPRQVDPGLGNRRPVTCLASRVTPGGRGLT